MSLKTDLQKFELAKQFYGWEYKKDPKDGGVNPSHLSEILGEGEWVVVYDDKLPLHNEVKNKHRVRLDPNGIIIFVSLKM